MALWVELSSDARVKQARRGRSSLARFLVYGTAFRLEAAGVHATKAHAEVYQLVRCC